MESGQYPPVLTLEAGAHLLHRDPRTLTTSLIPERGLPSARIGRRVYLWEPAVLAWLDGRTYEDASTDDPWRSREIITVTEAATILDLSAPTVRAHLQAGRIHASRIGRSYAIRWPRLRDRIAGLH